MQAAFPIGNGLLQIPALMKTVRLNILIDADPSAREIELAQEGNVQSRRVKCYKDDEPDKDLGPSCIIKCEDKPTPKPYVTPEGRKCGEELLTDYANKVIGYTEEDAQRRNPQVLFDNLIKPISPSELESLR